jgi:hypothetical protein
MEIALLVVASLTLVAAVVGAYFGYPLWKATRAKPDLRLAIEPGPATSAWFYIELHNEGPAPAEDWTLTLTSPTGERILPRDLPRPAAEGWSDRETETGWISTWTSTSTDLAIGSKRHRDLLVGPANNSPITIHADYVLAAARMEYRHGTIRVTIGEEPDRPQTIEVD